MLPTGARMLKKIGIGVLHSPVIAVALLSVWGMAACSKHPAPQVKRFHMQGKIISIDAANNSLTIDHQAIPGFMDAMTMAYPVHSAQALAGLAPGDEITADVVVPEDSSLYLENIVVTKKGTGAAAPTGALNPPQPGEKVPDFAFVDQDGKRIHISSFRGSPLVVTFIYTRCPYPDYCPLVSKGFAQIYALTRNTAGHQKVRLLSVSFDPDHDTPPVLREYAQRFKTTAGGALFDRWEFAAAPKDKLKDIANFFGLYYEESGPQIIHSMSTTVISPEGTVYKWYDSSDWKASDLVADATATLQDKASGGSARAQEVAAAAASPQRN
jgi:protein SCO1